MTISIKRLVLISAFINSFNASLNCAQQLDEEKRRARAIVELAQSVKSWSTSDIESLTVEIRAQKKISELIHVTSRENAEIIIRNKDPMNLVQDNIQK